MALVHSISHTSLPNSLTFSVPSLSTYVFIIVIDSHHSVQFSCSVVSNSLWPQELQHARPPCPSPTPRVHSKLMSIKSVIPSIHLILWCPFLLLPSVFLVFQSVQYSWASLVAQLVKNPPEMQETWVQSLGWEDALEKGKATHSSILA